MSEAAANDETLISLPNSELMARGINIIRYDPLDPMEGGGFTDYPIYSFGSLSPVDLPNASYGLPASLIYTPDPEYSFSSEAKVITNSGDVVKAFSGEVSIGVGISGGAFAPFLAGVGSIIASMASASFSASAGYKTLSQYSVASKSQSVISTAKASCWRLTNDSPAFDGKFTKAVQNLNTALANASLSGSQLQSLFFDFFDCYGTHVIKAAVYGGFASQNYMMTAEEFSTLSSSEVDIGVAAEVALGASLRVSASTQFENQATTDFASEVESTVVNMIGGSNESDWQAWVPTIVNNPVPVYLTLEDVSSLFGAVLGSTQNSSLVDQYNNYLRLYTATYASNVLRGVNTSSPVWGRVMDEVKSCAFGVGHGESNVCVWSQTAKQAATVQLTPTAALSTHSPKQRFGTRFWLFKNASTQELLFNAHNVSGVTVAPFYEGDFDPAGLNATQLVVDGTSNELTIETATPAPAAAAAPPGNYAVTQLTFLPVSEDSDLVESVFKGVQGWLFVTLSTGDIRVICCDPVTKSPVNLKAVAVTKVGVAEAQSSKATLFYLF